MRSRISFKSFTFFPRSIAAPYMNGIVIIRNAVLNRLTPQDLLIGVGTAVVYMVVTLAVAT